MIESVFVIFILFQNIFMQFVPSFFSYWDEMFCLTLIVYYFVCKQGKLIKFDFVYICLLTIVVIVGIVGNVAFGYQGSIDAVARDVVGFIKFPAVFLSLYRVELSSKFARKVYTLVPYIKMYIAIVFWFGILSLFVNTGMNQNEIRYAIHPYMFLYSHPTYLTTGIICLLCILNAVDEAGLKEDFLAIGSVVLAMRTKGLAFIAVYVFLKYGSRWLHRLKAISWILIVPLVFIVAWSKLKLYASFSNSPRESMYVGAAQLVRSCFPIGSGFATFASHISGKFFSEVYNIIPIAGLYGLDGKISPDIGDAGIPYYAGQFGFLGLLFLLALIYLIVKMSMSNLNENSRMPVLYLWIMIAISLPTEALLTNNGVELAFVMVVVSLLARENMNQPVSTKGLYI